MVNYVPNRLTTARPQSPHHGMEYDEEFWRWDADVRGGYEERLAILCDGGPVTFSSDRIARVEARKEQAIRIAQQASDRSTVSFGCGIS